jgi:hypothetical protein
MVPFFPWDKKCSTIVSLDIFGDTYNCDKACMSTEHISIQLSTMKNYYITSDINGYSLTRPHP